MDPRHVLFILSALYDMTKILINGPISVICCFIAEELYFGSQITPSPGHSHKN